MLAIYTSSIEVRGRDHESWRGLVEPKAGFQGFYLETETSIDFSGNVFNGSVQAAHTKRVTNPFVLN